MKTSKCPITLKLQFNNERHARNAIKKINSEIEQNKRFINHKRVKTTYKCEHCGKIHISSINHSTAKAIKNHIDNRKESKVEKKDIPEYMESRLEFLEKKTRTFKKR